jgi:uncharacterized protein (TIGR00251 family)
VTQPVGVWDGETLILAIRLQPKARRDEVVGIQGEHIKVRVTAPAVDGKANQRLIRFLAKEFQVARDDIKLISGVHSREKRLVIHSPKARPEWLLRL